MITKSHRFDLLVNQVCIIFYKKPSASLSEDTVNFIRRSIHELFRSKSKEQLHAQLVSSQSITARNIDNIIPPYEYIDNGQFINASLGESERLMTNVCVVGGSNQQDMLQGLRQTTDKDIEMMGQAGSMKHTDNITISIVCWKRLFWHFGGHEDWFQICWFLSKFSSAFYWNHVCCRESLQWWGWMVRLANWGWKD